MSFSTGSLYKCFQVQVSVNDVVMEQNRFYFQKALVPIATSRASWHQAKVYCSDLDLKILLVSDVVLNMYSAAFLYIFSGRDHFCFFPTIL